MSAVVQITFNPAEAPDEWIVSTSSTSTGYADVQAAMTAALLIFQNDPDIDAVMLDRAHDALIAANAATIASDKAALRAAEGLT